MVEAVEALTIVLAVAMVRGWRPAGFGALGGLIILAAIIIAMGPLLHRVPLNLLHLSIGVLLLLFGMRWLRKAILRARGSSRCTTKRALLLRGLPDCVRKSAGVPSISI